MHAPRSEPILVTPDDPARALSGLSFLARRLMRVATRLERGRLDVATPDGRLLRFSAPAPGPQAMMTLHDDARLARRVLLGGEIGFARAFVEGAFDTPDLAALLRLFAVNRPREGRVAREAPPVALLRRLRERLRRNTRAGARRNIAEHYDLGEAFYAAWLGPGMDYSAGMFDGPGDDDLTAAHARKHDAIARRTGIGPGDRVLEIGCGWGGFALHAAREIGCRVTGLTISRAQAEHARRRVFEEGLAELVEIRLEDYRDARGTYDAIVSIEMFEAVGEAYWDAFFAALRERLAPGRRAALQLITIDEARYPAYRGRVDFVRAEIFPGGLLPTRAIVRDLARRHAMPILSDEGFGEDYARTLALWRARFLAAWPGIAPLGFDEAFRRMWTYYLAYCEVGFSTANTDVRQVVLERQ